MHTFSYQHYVPILKTKAGERWAVSQLKPSSRRIVTPLFELHPHKVNGNDSHIANICKERARDWGTDRSLFVDTLWVEDGPSGATSMMEAVSHHAGTLGLKSIPVARSGDSRQRLHILGKIATDRASGCMLRLKPREI